MNIIIPMAGRGERFRKAGWTVPKPLISVKGIPMYARAASSLPLDLADRLIFVCLEEHLASGALSADIETRFGKKNTVIVALRGVTEGQACSVLAAKAAINPEQPLMIHNADTSFRSNLRQLITRGPATDGIVTVFADQDPRWSFALVNVAGEITQIAEKQVISNWATAGMYYFSRAADFIYTAETMIAKNLRTNNEFYVGPVYNMLIERGSKITADIAEEVTCMGTPEQLQACLSCGTIHQG